MAVSQPLIETKLFLQLTAIAMPVNVVFTGNMAPPTDIMQVTFGQQST